MDWLKKHVDTVMVLSAVISSVIWMNGKFNEVERRVDKQFSDIHQELAIIKTVLIMKNIMPVELVQSNKEVKIDQ